MKNNKLQYNVIKYKDNYGVLDIESYGDVHNARPHEITIAVLDNKHKIVKIFCLLNKDILLKSELQDSVYYKDKLPQYFYYIKNNVHDIEFIIGDSYTMLEALNNIIDTYNIKLIKGYNIDFDYKAINRLYNDVENNRIKIKKWHKELGIDYKTINKKLHNNFKKVNCFDLMYGYTTLLQNNKELRIGYAKYCVENSYYSESLKNISSKEDTMYRYFIDATHEEAHIGFLDVLDEIELDKKLRQFIHTKQLKNTTLLLNKKVEQAVYKGYGLYTIKNVNRELQNN